MTQTHARTLVVAAAVVAVVASGCTMKRQKEPPLGGPSENALSLAIEAHPDIIVQDGSSHSVITVRALDADAKPMGGLTIRADIVVSGAIANDFGVLSSTTLSTTSDGRAEAVYTAPPAPIDLESPDPIVEIWLTPIGLNWDNSSSRRVSIRLVKPGVIIIPGAPFAEFSFTPANPAVGAQVYFNASASSDPGGSIVSYEWDYGDGDQETGMTQSHDFTAAGIYLVTLTVTDNSGMKASKTRTITVAAAPPPTTLRP